MKEPTFSIPSSIKEAQQLLTVIGLPTLNHDAMMSIGRSEGRTFKEALTDTANGGPSADQNLAYLKAVITACAPQTRKVVHELGFDQPDDKALINISKKEGALFARAIRGMASSDTGDVQAAQQYLRHTLGSFCTRIKATAAADPTCSATLGATASSVPSNVTKMPQREATSAHAVSSLTEAPEGNGRAFQSFHLYGGKAAMCFSIDETKKGGVPTVRIEAAPSRGERVYDWEKKISFQLSLSELTLVFGVLYGYIPRIELVGHGAANEKSFSMEDQGGNYFFSLRARGNVPLAIPVQPKDTFGIMAMVFSRMKANFPEISDTQLMSFAKRICEKTILPANQPRTAANA